MTLEDVVGKIISSSGLSNEEVADKIKAKQKELADLVSAEGAAYIVAKEMGLDIITRARKEMKLNDLVNDSRNFVVRGRIIRIFETREYTKSGRTFKVAGIVLGDDGGTKRMSLWDAQTELIEMLKEGMAVEVFGGYARENNRGEVEIRLSKFGGIKILEQSDLPEVGDMNRGPSNSTLAGMAVNNVYSARATLVQLFETETFYEVCPTCGKRVRADDEFTCKEHGKVEPAYSFVVSGIIDDGSENMRAVLFRDAGAALLGLSGVEEGVKRKGKLFEGIDVVGKDFLFTGRVRMNAMFNRKEFIVSNVNDVDVTGEARKLVDSFKN